jgi:hypothetical protein
VKLPSRETQGDVRAAFGVDNKTRIFDASKRPSLAVLQDMRITKIDAHRWTCPPTKSRSWRSTALS